MSYGYIKNSLITHHSFRDSEDLRIHLEQGLSLSSRNITAFEFQRSCPSQVPEAVINNVHQVRCCNYWMTLEGDVWQKVVLRRGGHQTASQVALDSLPDF